MLILSSCSSQMKIIVFPMIVSGLFIGSRVIKRDFRAGFKDKLIVCVKQEHFNHP